MVSTSVLHRLRAAPAASDKAASFPARGRTVPVQESSWHPLGMPLPAVRGAKHSCATASLLLFLHLFAQSGRASQCASYQEVVGASSPAPCTRRRGASCAAPSPLQLVSIARPHAQEPRVARVGATATAQSRHVTWPEARDSTQARWFGGLARWQRGVRFRGRFSAISSHKG